MSAGAVATEIKGWGTTYWMTESAIAPLGQREIPPTHQPQPITPFGALNTFLVGSVPPSGTASQSPCVRAEVADQ